MALAPTRCSFIGDAFLSGTRIKMNVPLFFACQNDILIAGGGNRFRNSCFNIPKPPTLLPTKQRIRPSFINNRYKHTLPFCGYPMKPVDTTAPVADAPPEPLEFTGKTASPARCRPCGEKNNEITALFSHPGNILPTENNNANIHLQSDCASRYENI